MNQTKRTPITEAELAVIRKRFEWAADDESCLTPEEKELEASALRKLRYLTVEEVRRYRAAV